METAGKAKGQGLKLAAIIGGATAMLAVLFFFAPDEYSFYPRCLLHTLTGLQCPGCGGLRAAHQLLHGNVAAAFHYNPLLVLLSPLLAAFVIAAIGRETTGRTVPRLFKHPVWIWVLVGLLIAYGIIRNLPLHRSGS
jgi:hypothetical protein